TAWWTAIVTDAQRRDLERRFPLKSVSDEVKSGLYLRRRNEAIDSNDKADARMRWMTAAFVRNVSVNDPDGALEDIHHCFATDDSKNDRYYRDYLDARGFIYLRLGRMSEALSDFKEACKNSKAGSATLKE